jgi:hypothetical protein
MNIPAGHPRPNYYTGNNRAGQASSADLVNTQAKTVRLPNLDFKTKIR